MFHLHTIYYTIFLNSNTPRTLELFVDSLLTKTLCITNARNAKTLSPSHMKQCIMSESRFDFLRELVRSVPDINVEEQQSMGQLQSSFYPGGSVSDPDEESPPHSTASLPPMSYAPPLANPMRSAAANVTTSSFTVGVDAFQSGHQNQTPPVASHPPYFETVGRSLMLNKQQSLDLTLASTAAVTADLRQPSTAPANYYTEIQSTDSADESDDVRSPKMARLQHTAAATAAPPVYGMSRTAPCTPSDFSPTPIINFDFTKGLGAAYMQPFHHHPTSASALGYSSQPITAAATTAAATHVPRISVTVSDKHVTALMMPVVTQPSRGIVVHNVSPPQQQPRNTSRKTTYQNVIDMRTTPSPSASSATRQFSFNGHPAAKGAANAPAPRGRPPKNRAAYKMPSVADTPSSNSTAAALFTAIASSSEPLPSSSSSASTSAAAASASPKANGFAMPAPPTNFFAACATNSCLDMDEDYDNI